MKWMNNEFHEWNGIKAWIDLMLEWMLNEMKLMNEN